MNFVYIFVIIVVIQGGECFIEDTTSIKISEQQRTLLRKLQNFQDPKDHVKPLTWNEMLADVVVNRIKIFSFNRLDANEPVKNFSLSSDTNNILTRCFSQVLLFYKNCFYDKWMTRYEEPDYINTETTPKPDGILKSDTPRNDMGGPKGDIEIIEPKYHGKLQEVDTDEDAAKNDCPENSVKDDKGNCIKVTSRLLISVPNQCPTGYRADRLGNCRLIFF